MVNFMHKTSSAAIPLAVDANAASKRDDCFRQIYLSWRVWWINRHMYPWHVDGLRLLMVTALIMLALLTFFADLRYGDMPMSKWCIGGAIAGSAGGFVGCCTALVGQCTIANWRVPVSRHGLGSYSDKCCLECSRDAAMALMALTLSLLAAAALGSAIVGLLGLLLSMLRHYEVHHGWETLANATEHEFSLILSSAAIVVAIYAAVRHHNKTRAGWWIQGEHLLDGDFEKDLGALL